MKKYQIQLNASGGIKKGMIFQWDKEEHCYTTKELPWFLTPLIERGEMGKRIKLGQFRELKNRAKKKVKINKKI